MNEIGRDYQSPSGVGSTARELVAQIDKDSTA